MTPGGRTIPDTGPLSGGMLVLCACLLAVGNLLAVLDITIANVSIPNIAGGLAVSTSQGTWVVTTYGIAEAITVPLTGWLARRFGQIRTFCAAMAAFGVCSALCGFAHSFYLLVFLRVLQGLAGGPMIPLAQTLLLSIFPKERATTAGTIWTLGVSVGPVLGPLLGGVLCDTYSWPWIFFINVPVALGCAAGSWFLLRRREGPTTPQHIDWVGLGLLVVWICALQIMLDRGRELDWFSSPFIVGCLIVAILGFIAFVIWELTDPDPIVDLTVFRHRGYTVLVTTLCFGYGGFFASVVLSPLWMQTSLGYRATQAAIAVAPPGLVMVLLASTIQKMMGRYDKRLLIFFGVFWLALVMAWRSTFASNVAFHSILYSHIAMGLGLAFFLLPVYSTILSNLPPAQIPGGAGLMSFMRTTAGAFAASIVTTAWDDAATRGRTGILDSLDGSGAINAGVAAGFPPEQALYAADTMVQNESVMLATNHVYLALAVILAVAAFIVWFAPRPQRVGIPVNAH